MFENYQNLGTPISEEREYTRRGEEPNLVHSINFLKQCVQYQDFSELKRVRGGSVCTCYVMYGRKMYNKAILKISDSRLEEDRILHEFGHLKSIPNLLWRDANHSIVEYFNGEYAYYAKATDCQLKQLISDYYFIATRGYLLHDMSTSNILFNKEEGFKIIDVGDYTIVNGYTQQALYDSTESRFWATLGSCVTEEQLTECREYAKRILEVLATEEVHFLKL